MSQKKISGQKHETVSFWSHLDEIPRFNGAIGLADIFTVHANIAGVPALSIPNGVDGNGMPIGLQIMANMHEDAALLALAKSLA